MRTLSPSTSAKLFAVGATVGPLVDSFHNQCLLRYHRLPIVLDWPDTLSSTWISDASTTSHLFCSSWLIPPLLGVAYVVLGGVLPRFFEAILSALFTDAASSSAFTRSPSLSATPTVNELQSKSILAVVTTAAIIKLSEVVTTSPLANGLPLEMSTESIHMIGLLVIALLQWAILDTTLPALLAASITSIGGPLSELPFVANDWWVYLDGAADYLPLTHVTTPFLPSLLGENYQNLALSSITGPCYFAVTMDAIALGRWFDAQEEESSIRDTEL